MDHLTSPPPPYSETDIYSRSGTESSPDVILTPTTSHADNASEYAASVNDNDGLPQQKRLLGETLFSRIEVMQPELARKITGMLLELDNTEIIKL
jgi:hypothetical protein